MRACMPLTFTNSGQGTGQDFVSALQQCVVTASETTAHYRRPHTALLSEGYCKFPTQFAMFAGAGGAEGHW